MRVIELIWWSLTLEEVIICMKNGKNEVEFFSLKFKKLKFKNFTIVSECIQLDYYLG